jgi:hypothetical protein
MAWFKKRSHDIREQGTEKQTKMRTIKDRVAPVQTHLVLQLLFSLCAV